MRYDPHLLDRIKDKLLLSHVIAARVKLRRAGKEYTGLCPFHTEKTPSFTVNDQKGFYHCFGCGAHGNVFDFWMGLEKMTFPQAVERGADLAGISLPAVREQDPVVAQKGEAARQLFEDVTNWFEAQLWGSGGETARQYLKMRGISEKTARHFRLGYAPKSENAFLNQFPGKGQQAETLEKIGLLKQREGHSATSCRFVHRLIFPITSAKGSVVGFGGRALDSQQIPKYLNSPETDYFKKGALLYNFAQLTKQKALLHALVIVEGYMDVISLYEKGYTEAVAPLGTAITEMQLQLAWRLSNEPILLMDGDAAGRRAEKRAMDRILPLLQPNYSFSFVRLPQGEDPDSMIQNLGLEKFNRIIGGAVSLIEGLWDHIYDPMFLKTPEKMAYLEKLLGDVVQSIKDRTIQYHYRKKFQERLYTVQRRSQRPKELDKGLRISKPPDFVTLQYKILLAIIYVCPCLLEDIIEELAHLDVPASWIPIKEGYIQYFYDGRALENPAFHDYLEQQGLEKQVKQLGGADLVTHAPFLKNGEDKVRMKEGWDQVMAALQMRTLQQERKEVGKNLQRNFTQKEWERYQALLREEKDQPS